MSNNSLEFKNDIENKLDIFKINNSKLDNKYNETVYSFTLEEEKKFIKEIKVLSDENIQIIKCIKNLMSLNKIDPSNDYVELLKTIIKYFYKGQCYYKERLTLKMYQQYRVIKPDLKDDEIAKALQDSSPDQIFYKTSFGFNGFNESSKSALVYIQYRHHDLKTLNLTIKEIQLVSNDFNINWDLSTESPSFKKRIYQYNTNSPKTNISNNNNNCNIYNSPTISSIILSANENNNNDNKTYSKKKEEQDAKDGVKYIKKQLRSTTNSRRFLIFNIWCCGEQ